MNNVSIASAKYREDSLCESAAKAVASRAMADTSPPRAENGKKSPRLTPFLEQYLGIKAKHPDALLFFRMGDFYELFFEDAEDAAAILDITLTARGEYDGKPIPMAGVPFHAAEGYLARLIKSGRRVAVCEQTESPAEAKKRGSKAIVNRDIVRIVTPGTLTEDALLPARQGQALAAIAFGDGGTSAALAVCDVSTGAFEVQACKSDLVYDLLVSWPVREILARADDLDKHDVRERLFGLPTPLTERPARSALPATGEALLKEAFGVQALDAFGEFSRVELSAIGLLLDYVKLTQAGADIRLDRPLRMASDGYLSIDPATRASLEIDRTLAGERTGSLLASIDRTVTPVGARLLAARLARPSLDITDIRIRQDAVSWMLSDAETRKAVRDRLKSAPDIERARTRLRLGRGGPRDLQAIGRALVSGAQAAAECLRGGQDLPEELRAATDDLTLSRVPGLSALAQDLSRALSENLPSLAREGGFVASGWDDALDNARTLRDDSRKIIAALQARYADETGISGLKIKFNNVLGYFVDVSARQGEALMKPPLSETFIHRQTLANNIRFSTQELSELAGRISRAEDEAKGRELEIFDGFCARVDALNEQLSQVADAIARLDVAVANADWSEEVDAVCPSLDDSTVFAAEGLRHPVVEASLRKDGKGFTPNDLMLDAETGRSPRLLLITGPNMAGKSTYLRQAALAVIMAQAGCFVAARKLELGLVDRVFSRVGASDDLARGRSTFMVEMVETAAILTQAGPRSFVILDEVGRGTSTYDGLAIAWAAVEHLHATNRCRAMFATHYHELTKLADDLDAAANASLRAREWKNDLVFLHEVHSGPADKSYGVQVAKLAGLPRKAVNRAAQILKKLEATPDMSDALPLFAAAESSQDLMAPEPADIPEVLLKQQAFIEELDLDNLTPREALNALYTLKSLG